MKDSKSKAHTKLNDENIDKKISDLEEQVANCNEKYLRSLADYQNLSNRIDEEKRKATQFANEKLMKELASIIADMEIAQSHTEDKGLIQLYEKMFKILRDNGLSEIVIVDNETDFNPEMHEAIETKEGADNKILKVYRKGYLLNSKVLYPALVCVGKESKK